MNRMVAWIVTAAMLVAHSSGIAGRGALGADVFEGVLWMVGALLFYLGYRDHPRSFAPLAALGACALVLAFETRRLAPDERSALVFAFGPLATAQLALAMGRLRGSSASMEEELGSDGSSAAQTIALLQAHARSLRGEGRHDEADKLEGRIEIIRERAAEEGEGNGAARKGVPVR